MREKRGCGPLAEGGGEEGEDRPLREGWEVLTPPSSLTPDPLPPTHTQAHLQAGNQMFSLCGQQPFSCFDGC